MYTTEQEEARAKVLALMEQADAAIAEARSYLASQGELLDLTKWVTIKKYCELFDTKNTETVSNWIRRGIIPPTTRGLSKNLTMFGLSEPKNILSERQNSPINAVNSLQVWTPRWLYQRDILWNSVLVPLCSKT